MFWRTMAGAVVVSAALSAVCYAGPPSPPGPPADRGPADPPGPPIDPQIVQQGFAISPIAQKDLNLRGKDADLVGLGSYLVNAVADCNGCHALPKFLPTGGAGSNPTYGDPFLGMKGDQTLTDSPVRANFNVKHFLAGGRCFGPVMSYNITPDPNLGYLPAGLTESEFIRMMRTGEDIACEKPGSQNQAICNLTLPSTFNTNVLQTMPWPTFHNMPDRDLKAIYAYLSAVPHAEACNTAADGCPGASGAAAGNLPNHYAYLNNADGTCPSALTVPQ